jgi:two-component system chemotaxis sensor kinase CheA
VALVLNPAGIIEAFQQSNGKPDFVVANEVIQERVSTILVVDDSITTRTLERSILEAHGYQVRVAVDGLEALEQLRANPADLVIADVQMPRMDGFALVAEIKKDSRLARIPVIIVSSLERREEQERGLALGADAYIVKRKFDQQELLDAIRQIL